MNIKIIRLHKKFINQFYKSFSKQKDFKVNNKISFYEKKEILEWTKDKKNNLLYVILLEKDMAGFCFVKKMSFHWAIIDGFYIKKEYRRRQLATKLQNFIEDTLIRMKIKYVSRTPKENNFSLHRFLKRNGYTKRNKYIWFDKFL